MCGIAGIVGPGHLATMGRLAKMARAMAHRGPDGEGYVLDSPEFGVRVWHGAPEDAPSMPAAIAGFGHRRLSIIDRAGGQQPLSNEDGTVWITYNGELYNYEALRRRLEARGHHFKTHTDTEVIVHQYEEEGPDCLEALEGIFAFGLWDRAKRRLLLARDRLGVKPLYYAWHGKEVLFASEIKGLLATGCVDRTRDEEALAQYLCFQNMFGDRTLLRSVRLLPPGCRLMYEPMEDRIIQQRWWQWRFQPDDTVSVAEWAGRVREEFVSVVERQLVGEVPIGSFLSGGLDTGAIAAVASRKLSSLPTFTCGFALEGVAEDERRYDERLAAHTLAQWLGTDHHSLELSAQDMWRLIPQAVWHLDEPRVGMSYQNLAVARFARQWVTVMLSGVGGDELFGGYAWRYRSILGLTDPRAFADAYTQLWTRVVAPDELSRLVTAPIWHQIAGFHPQQAVEQVLADCPTDDPLHRALWFDTQTFLHGLLVMEDKLSMACGLEVRTPFTDERLLAIVQRIPARIKMNEQETKIVLKQAMAPLLPEATLQRPKMGFVPPERSWQRQRAQKIRWLLLGPEARSRDLFRSEYVEQKLTEHEQGRVDHRRLIWSLICLEWWSRFTLAGEHPVDEPSWQPFSVSA